MKKVIYLWLSVIIIMVLVGACCIHTLNNCNDLVIYESLDQLALEARERLNDGNKVDDLLSSMDINTDYTPFIIVYDDKTTITYTNIINDFTEYTLPLTISITDDTSPTHSYWKPDTDNVYVVSSLRYRDGYLAIGRNNNINDLSLSERKASIIYLIGALSLLTLPIIIGLRKLFATDL